jgi:NAD(P)-dependent dehydrogenase (short-subunit alcohol dehydrogenase family)
MDGPRVALVFGARNLGRAIAETLLEDGWKVAAAARSEATLDGVRALGALALEADVTDPGSVRATFEAVRAEYGAVDLAVNAASPAGGDRSGPFGGGPITRAAPEAFDAWTVPAARGAFGFLSGGGAWLADAGRPATMIQFTGGSARRAIAGRGLWAAGAFAVRALTNAAALELRDVGIQVALVLVDAGIQPLSGPPRGELAQLADSRQIAAAVRFLADQDARNASHELVITPLAERWVP